MTLSKTIYQNNTQHNTKKQENILCWVLLYCMSWHQFFKISSNKRHFELSHGTFFLSVQIFFSCAVNLQTIQNHYSSVRAYFNMTSLLLIFKSHLHLRTFSQNCLRPQQYLSTLTQIGINSICVILSKVAKVSKMHWASSFAKKTFLM